MSNFLSMGNWRQQCVKQMHRSLKSFPTNYPSDVFAAYRDARNDLESAQRFVLPAGMGHWFEISPHLDMQTDRLPFDLVAFEYEPAGDVGLQEITIFGQTTTQQVEVRQRLILAKQLPNSVLCRLFFRYGGAWGFYPWAVEVFGKGDIPESQLSQLRRNALKEKISPGLRESNYVSQPKPAIPSLAIVANLKGANSADIWNDTQEEAHVVAVALALLSCRNVRAEKRTQSRTGVKSASKFSERDTYWQLTVGEPDSSRQSDRDDIAGAGSERNRPREHLRRGHIYQPRPGLKVWRQSCVVNAGIGGRVQKDYAFS